MYLDDESPVDNQKPHVWSNDPAQRTTRLPNCYLIYELMTNAEMTVVDRHRTESLDVIEIENKRH